MAANPAFAATKSLVQHIQNDEAFLVDGKKPLPIAAKQAAAQIIGNLLVSLMHNDGEGDALRAEVEKVIIDTQNSQPKKERKPKESKAPKIGIPKKGKKEQKKQKSNEPPHPDEEEADAAH